MNRRRSTLRHGMTLIEVVVALGILAGALLSMAEYGRRYSRGNANSMLLNQATDLAVARIERVKAERSYTSMDSLAITETGIPGYARFVRQAQRLRTNTVTTDYKTWTVTVTHPQLTTPVTKTTAIARF